MLKQKGVLLLYAQIQFILTLTMYLINDF
jgi:hypothetical protein